MEVRANRQMIVQTMPLICYYRKCKVSLHQDGTGVQECTGIRADRSMRDSGKNDRGDNVSVAICGTEGGQMCICSRDYGGTSVQHKKVLTSLTVQALVCSYILISPAHRAVEV